MWGNAKASIVGKIVYNDVTSLDNCVWSQCLRTNMMISKTNYAEMRRICSRSKEGYIFVQGRQKQYNKQF